MFRTTLVKGRGAAVCRNGPLYSLLPSYPFAMPALGLRYAHRRAERFDSKDPWVVLGVHPESSREQIKTAYFALLMELHPDRAVLNDIDPALAKDDLAKVMWAYESIRRHHKQSSYERHRHLRREPVYRPYYPTPGDARNRKTWNPYQHTATAEHDFSEQMGNLASRFAIDTKTRNRALMAWFGSICAYFAFDFHEYNNQKHSNRMQFPQLQIRGVR